MDEARIIAQLNRIEEYTLLAAKNVLNVQDVCLLTGLSRMTVYHLCNDKKIPHYKQGKLYFKRAEVEAWLTSHRVATQTEIDSKAALYCMEHKSEPKGFAYTYLMFSNNTGLYKIGRTNNLEERKTALQGADPSIEIESYTSGDYESQLHHKYEKQRIHRRREWFNLSENQVSEIKQFFKTH